MRNLSLSIFTLLSLLTCPGFAEEYSKSEIQYVLAAGNPVEVSCDEGSKFVKGDCWAEEFPPDQRPRGIYLDSQGKDNGWRCQTTHQDVRQTLRIVARVFCSR